MAVKINSKGKYYVYGKYKDTNGVYKGYQRQTEFTSKKKAKEFDKQYKQSLENKEVIDEGLKITDLIELYTQNKELKYNTLKTIETFTNTINKKELNYKLSQLNTALINKIANHVNVGVFKRFLNFGYKHRLIEEKYADFILVKSSDTKKKYKIVSVDEIEQIERAFIKDIAFFLYDSGLRVKECLSITFDRIYDNYIVIDRQIVNKQFQSLKSKNSQREIPITKRMKEIITRQSKVEDGFLFGGAKSFHYISLQQYLKKHCTFTAHDLRHTHATNLIEYSYDVLGYCDKDNIAKHMGHTVAMLETTYKHLFRDKKDEILKVLEYVNNKSD